MSAFKQLAGPLLRVAGARGFAAAGEAPGRKVAVMGAAGGIGQPLSLLMKVKKNGERAVRAAARFSRSRAVRPRSRPAFSLFPHPRVLPIIWRVCLWGQT